jgi:hypothetical protein
VGGEGWRRLSLPGTRSPLDAKPAPTGTSTPLQKTCPQVGVKLAAVPELRDSLHRARASDRHVRKLRGHLGFKSRTLQNMQTLGPPSRLNPHAVSTVSWRSLRIFSRRRSWMFRWPALAAEPTRVFMNPLAAFQAIVKKIYRQRRSMQVKKTRSGSDT